MTELEEIINTAQKAGGWCHLNKEIVSLAQEVLKLKKEIIKLKKLNKKVVDDE